MGWKPEVRVDGQWNQNSLVFATEEEAQGSAMDLFSRWTLCVGHRAVEVDEGPSYKREDGRDSPLTSEEDA